jgi:hypothetical protein
VAKAVDKRSPLNVAATTVSVRATIISVRATVVAASVVPAAYHRAGRKTADKARAKSATTMAMPMLRLS